MTATQAQTRKRQLRSLIGTCEITIQEAKNEIENLDKFYPERPKVRRNLKAQRMEKYRAIIYQSK
jgi:hypothetical protein